MAASGSSSSSTVVRLLLIVLAAGVLFALVSYYNHTKQSANERFSTPQVPMSPLAPVASAPSPSQAPSSLSASGAFAQAVPAPSAVEPTGNEQYLPVGNDALGAGATVRDPFPQDKITPDQLLPKDAANSTWAQVNPAGQGDVKDQNFLTAGYHIGFDTQGSSLRNASHDLRSTPPNPRYRVSIWQQSGIEPDLHRKQLE